MAYVAAGSGISSGASSTTIGGSVARRTSSTVTPGASSCSSSPSAVMSSTARSVMIRCTQALPVSGRLHSFTILWLPSLARCSIITMTRFAPCTRSIAPPMPLTILPGIIQLARSPRTETCMAPRIATSMCPPRIMPKEVAESKNEAPGRTVTVSLPALIRSGSTWSSVGYGPTPRMPFSDCSTTCTPSGTWFGTRVGSPMPRLTYCPSHSSWATRAASWLRVRVMPAPPGSPALVPRAAQPSSLPARAAGSRARSWLAPDRAALDPLAALADRADHPLHEDARGVHVLRRDLAGLDQPLHLGDGDPTGRRAQRVEVARARVVPEVAVPVPDRRADQAEVADDAGLQDVLPAVEHPGLLFRRADRDAAGPVVPPRQPAVGHLGAHAGRRVERRNASAAGPQPLGQCPLWTQLDLELAGQELPLELLVLPDVGPDGAPDPLGGEQPAEPPVVHAAVVRHRDQVGHPGLQQRLDQHMRDATQAEPADRQRRAVRNVADRLDGAVDHLVHTAPPSSGARRSAPSFRL